MSIYFEKKEMEKAAVWCKQRTQADSVAILPDGSEKVSLRNMKIDFRVNLSYGIAIFGNSCYNKKM